MSDLKIQKIWQCSFDSFLSSGHPVSDIQKKVSHAVMRCKSGALGANTCQCTECGHTEFHNNSCRNRNCPNCQAVLKEIWVDKRREEVIDAPYFHVVFTLPHELNPLIYCNQKLLYGLFHRCCAETLLELSYDKKYLGATPGIIQVLHTWNQEIGYVFFLTCCQEKSPFLLLLQRQNTPPAQTQEGRPSSHFANMQLQFRLYY